ncbi:MAG: FAD-dependent oxidoreductase [bacterium]
MKQIVILGAGITGLSTAFHLKHNYEIFEKEDISGGLCRSNKINDFIFDYTGHLLHFKNERVKNLCFNLLENNLKQKKRNAYVHLLNQDIKYPFQLYFGNLPSNVVIECILSLLEEQEKKKCFLCQGKIQQIKNFQDWMIANYGKGISKYFMIPYNEKLWQFPLTKMSFEWINKTIPNLKQIDILKSAFLKHQSNIGYNAFFWYPSKDGIEKLVQAFNSHIKKVNLKEEIYRISLKDHLLYFKSGIKIKYDKLVSTIPLPELITMIDEIPLEIKKVCKNLKWTSVYNLNIGLNKSLTNKKHWIYFPEKQYPFYRIGFYSNFSSYLVPENKSSIYTEFAYFSDSKINKKDIKNKTIKSLIDIGIINSDQEILFMQENDIKYAYVIYDLTYKENMNLIKNFLTKHNIYSIGRFGGWQYFSIEDCILEGIETAQFLNKI